MVFIFLVTIDDVNFVIISKAYKVIWKVDLTMKNNRITGGLVVILTVVIGLLLTTQWSSPISAAQQPSVQYRTHVQDIGWQPYVANGQMAGTTGQGKRLEATTIQLANQDSTMMGSIQYQTHIQNIGWQNWTQDGGISGTSGQSLRLEAIRIKLSGNIANYYDVYYRVHAQNFGWLGWAANGQAVGTAGYGYRLEALEVVLVPKGQPAPGSTANAFYNLNGEPSVQYRTHVQDIGWQNFVSDGQTSGTTGQGKRLEATTIQLGNQNAATSGSIQYQTQIQNIGWQNWVQDGALSGTQGQSLRLETIRIKLTGNIANSYNVYYRVHAQNFGWLGWASNGQDAGTVGYGYRLEALQIVLVPKGQPAPGDTTNPSYTRKPDPSIHYQTNVQNSGWQTSVADGATAGTMGQALRVEAFKANVSDLPDNMSGGVTYKAYVQNVGWQSAVNDNAVAGTSGQGLRVEALSFNLTGTLSDSYDIYYRTYVQNYGWLGWASNGQTAGTSGRGLRIEAIQVQLVKKGGTAPGGGTAYLPPIAPSDFIDVSSHQSWLTQADYKAMYAAGIKTAVIKLSEYTTYKNPYAATQISYARNAGMKIAAYHYAWFTNSTEAAIEATYFANYAKVLGLPSDTVMVDDYEEGYAVNSSGDKVADLNAFRNTLAQQGYSNVVNYSYKAITGSGNIVDTDRLNTKDIWLAQYPNEANPAAARALQYNSEFAAWQYSASKYFTGLSQNKPLDISIDYTGRFTN